MPASFDLLMPLLSLVVCRVAGICVLSVVLNGCDDRLPAPEQQLLSGDGHGQAATTEVDEQEHGLHAVEAYVRQPAPGQAVAAAFVTFKNSTDETYTLNNVSSPRANSVAVHRTTHDGGVMAMRPVDRLVVSPHTEIVFRPGDYHLMLSGLRGSFSAGERIPLHFGFDDGVALEVSAEVRPVN